MQCPNIGYLKGDAVNTTLPLPFLTIARGFARSHGRGRVRGCWVRFVTRTRTGSSADRGNGVTRGNSMAIRIPSATTDVRISALGMAVAPETGEALMTYAPSNTIRTLDSTRIAHPQRVLAGVLLLGSRGSCPAPASSSIMRDRSEWAVKTAQEQGTVGTGVGVSVGIGVSVGVGVSVPN
jgi:hypothetical protein